MYCDTSEKWGLSYAIQKNGVNHIHLPEKEANHILGSAEEKGPFGTHIRTMLLYRKLSPSTPLLPPAPAPVPHPAPRDLAVWSIVCLSSSVDKGDDKLPKLPVIYM